MNSNEKNVNISSEQQNKKLTAPLLSSSVNLSVETSQTT